MSNQRIVVDCKITAHASPRWKAAKSEAARLAENEALARRRADAVKKLFEQKMRLRLSDYSIEFMYDQCILDEESLPNGAVLIGADSRGQRDSINAAKGNRSNNDQAFRKVDIDVTIARKIDVPTTVAYRYKQPTKTDIWYASAAVAIGYHNRVGATAIFVQLRNLWNQKATGVAYAMGSGFGVSGVGKLYKLARQALKDQKELLRISVGASFGDEASMITNRKVGFGDFHGRAIRFTAANIQLVAGWEWSYITFLGLGDGAKSVPVGGFSLGADAGASLNSGVGQLFLVDVPADWILRDTTATEWQTGESLTRHAESLSFATGSDDLTEAKPQLEKFISSVVRDFRGK